MSSGEVLRFFDSVGKITDVSTDSPLPITGGGSVGGDALPVQIFDAAGNPVSYGFTPARLNAAGTVVYKTGAGMIGKIKCNKAGTTDTLSVYDGTSAAGILLGVITSAPIGTTYFEGDLFGVGLCIVAAGTVGDYTVSIA